MSRQTANPEQGGKRGGKHGGKQAGKHSGENRFYGLDASIYIFRAYFARPVTALSPQGYPLNAVEGFAHTLLSLIDRVQPRYLVAAFDESLGQGFREQLYPLYKSRRALPDEALAFQLAACRSMAEVLGICCLSDSHYEADDLLASAARIAREAQRSVTVITRDKDLAQILTSDSDQLWDSAARGQTPLSRRQWEAHYGVSCNRLADYLAVCGDSVDDIPGLPGVGEKSAKNIFNNYSNLEEIYDNLDDLRLLPIRGAAKLAAKFTAHRDDVFLYRQLTRLQDTLALPAGSASGAYQGSDAGAFSELAQSLGFPPQWAAGLVKRYSGVFGQ